MAGIWVYSENLNITKQLLTLGTELAGELKQSVYAVTLDEYAGQILINAGAGSVYVLKNAAKHSEDNTKVITKLIADNMPQVLLVGATLRGKEVAARIAANLNACLISEALEVKVQNDKIQTERVIYGGLAIRAEEISFPAIITIPARKYEVAVEEAGRQGRITEIEVSNDSKLEIRSICAVEKTGVDLEKCDKVVCVGRGMKQKEDLKLAYDLADIIGGAGIGCSRSIAEDYSWLPEDTYVGISGKKVKPQLYISMGISGQVQHVAGIRDSKIIVAIDTNDTAPIFQAADYGIVGDMYEAVPLLIEEIKKAR